MVESSRQLILNRLPQFEGLAIYAALCMGLMFLFRKSAFLTDNCALSGFINKLTKALLKVVKYQRNVASIWHVTI
jgi:hypothetical protein